MNVLHVIPSLDLAEGGPSVAVPMLARAISQPGNSVALITTQRAKGEGRRAKGEEPGAKGGVEYIYAKRNTQFYKVSWELVRWLNANIRKFDLVHIHALFSFSSTVAAHIAHRAGVPYIIRPLGVLNQWGLKNRRALLKSLSLLLIEKRILTHAAAVHYTAAAEREEAGKIGGWVAKLPSFIVPLPVQPPVIGDQLSVNGKNEEFLQKYPQLRGKQIVLFLSRIHQKKGIELLFEAFASVRKVLSDIVLVIAGSGDGDYEARLRQKAADLGIAESIVWTGFVDGRGQVGHSVRGRYFRSAIVFRKLRDCRGGSTGGRCSVHLERPGRDRKRSGSRGRSCRHKV